MSTNTSDRLITAAWVNAQYIARGDTPSVAQQASGLDALNDVIRVEQTQSLKLFLQIEQKITLVAGKQTYTMLPGGDVSIARPLQVLQGYYLDVNNFKRPIDPPLSRDEWTRLSNNAGVAPQQGAVTSYFVDKQANQYNVKLWYIPDAQAATGAVYLVIRQQAGEIAAYGNNIVFPPEWFLFLQWAVADELATGQPQAVIERCAQRRAFYKEQLDNADYEDTSTSMQPDPRGPRSAFR
jgi:hypothetical protein